MVQDGNESPDFNLGSIEVPLSEVRQKAADLFNFCGTCDITGAKGIPDVSGSVFNAAVWYICSAEQYLAHY